MLQQILGFFNWATNEPLLLDDMSAAVSVCPSGFRDEGLALLAAGGVRCCSRRSIGDVAVESCETDGTVAVSASLFHDALQIRMPILDSNNNIKHTCIWKLRQQLQGPVTVCVAASGADTSIDTVSAKLRVGSIAVSASVSPSTHHERDDSRSPSASSTLTPVKLSQRLHPQPRHTFVRWLMGRYHDETIDGPEPDGGVMAQVSFSVPIRGTASSVGFGWSRGVVQTAWHTSAFPWNFCLVLERQATKSAWSATSKRKFVMSSDVEADVSVSFRGSFMKVLRGTMSGNCVCKPGTGGILSVPVPVHAGFLVASTRGEGTSATVVVGTEFPEFTPSLSATADSGDGAVRFGLNLEF